VRSQNELTAVCVKEIFNPIGAKLDDIACAVGVSDKVWLDTKVLVAICWV